MALTNRIFYIPRPDRLVNSLKSRLRTPEIEIEAVCEVLSQYRLEMATPPRNLTLSKRNSNLVVKTSAGKKVLKRYWQGWPAPVIVFEHSILTRLAELNYPAPRLVLTPSGETIISRVGQNYALFDFQDGRSYATNYLLRAHRLKLMMMAGSTLARLHQRLAGFMPEGYHHSGFKSYTGERWRDMTWHINKVEELKEKARHLSNLDDKVHADRLIQKSHYILDELGQLDEMLSAAPLPRLLIHGDYGLHNIHFHKDGKVTPLDFESARLEWRLRDLVSSLARFRYANEELDFESIRCFVAGYQSEFPLKSDEWHLVPQVWRFSKLQDAVKYWNSYFETGGPTRKLVSAYKAVDQADWVLEHSAELPALIKYP